MRRTLLGVLVSLLLVLSSASAQTSSQSTSNPAVGFKVLYNFTGYSDGCCIFGGVARDAKGNLYGVAYLNDQEMSYGDLFKLTRSGNLQVLQSFTSTDGECRATPVFDSAGNLYGVCTAVPNAGTLWEYSSKGKFSVLHTFNSATDGMEPEDSVAFDKAGNIYGTTYISGTGFFGTLWKYSPSTATFTVLHAFADGTDGDLLTSGPRIDSSGKVWGTTISGPNCYFCGNGTVWNYDLNSGTFTTVFDLASYGIQNPQGRFAVDSAGNLFGVGFGPGRNDCGLIYEMSPSNGYQPTIVYQFTTAGGCVPYGSLFFSAQGNIFGTTYLGGTLGDGVAYELKPVNGTWQETVLHSFSLTDGLYPLSILTTDGAGNWFGTTQYGGANKWGTIFEISGAN